ncbi:MAG: glutathione S-transferase family protein [Pseudomonadota bacterium]
MLHAKNIAHEVTYLNPKDLPSWLSQLSPLGKVPLLRVLNDEGEHEAVVFESQVINEFLDENYGLPLMPQVSLERARQRGFVAVADGILGSLWNWMVAKDTTGVDDARAAICQSLRVLNEALRDDEEFFTGVFGIVDCAMLPFFMRLQELESAGAEPLPCADLPRVAAYRRNLLALPLAKTSVVPEFSALYLGFVKSQGGLLGGGLR